MAVRSDKPAPATAAAIVATPAVMAFHRVIIADYVCLIAPMFLEQFIADVRVHTPGASIGAVSHSGEDADITALHAAADINLYAAKREKYIAT